MQEDKNAIFQMRFPQKLWYLLSMRTDAVLWGGTGRTILLNYRILHNYLQCDHSIFKTTNISSFVRQLNLYGFRKVTSHLQDPLCNSCNPYMHEYVHDFFQYGRPEFLNKITRKALAMKKNQFKNFYSNSEQSVYLTPLQKARRAFHEALKKTAQDLFMHSAPLQFCGMNFDCDESQISEFGDNEESNEFDWLPAKNYDKDPQPIPQTGKEPNPPNIGTVTEDSTPFISPEEHNLIAFKEDSSQQNTNFPTQFLSMPDLDPEPNERNNVELLAEFNIDANAQHRADMQDKDNEHLSLNCVLPCINNDPNDDATMSEKENENLDHYNGEWDQMFSDIMINKGNNQECGSDLKELYSQISRTIDLLND